MEKIELGDLVQDKIGGFKGIVTGLTKHLTGCDRANVQAVVTKDGKIGECYCFDLAAVKILKKGMVKPESVQEPEPNRKGGPPSKPTKAR